MLTLGSTKQNIPYGRAYLGDDLVYEHPTYAKLEYIQSTGTQYIDTGYKPNNNTRVVCKIIPTTIPSSWVFIYGGRNRLSK